VSWNTVLTFAQGTGPGQIGGVLAGFTASGASTSFDQATSLGSQGLAVGQAADWTVICHSADLPIPDEDLLIRASAGGQVLVLILGGTGDVYGMQLLRRGQLLREQIVSEGETVQESGEPMPEEAGLDAADHDEDWLFGLMEAVTGLTLDDLMPLTFEVWSADA
jgi:hypothetical protein